MHLLIAAIVAAHLASAKGACPDSQAQELARITAGPGFELLACGSRKPHVDEVRDLTIYRTGAGQERERLLDGDAAMKAYRFRKEGRGFVVEESLSAGPFRPFLQIRVSCDRESCAARDSQCLWKKEHSLPTGNSWSEKFTRALSGDAAAAREFEKPPAGDESASEAYYTLRADLTRLKTLGCLK